MTDRDLAARDWADRDLMDRHGIVRAPADYFLYRGYRYSSLNDAVAQAERDLAKNRMRL